MSQGLTGEQLLAFFGNSKRRAFAVAVGLLLVAGALWQFLVTGQQEALDQARNEAQARLGKQESMEKLVRRQPLTDKAVQELEAQLKALEGEGYLTPLLNSYAMRCKALLDPLTEKTGFAIAQFAEHSQRMLPVPKAGVPEQLQARQLITCTGTGSYRQMMEFVEKLEDTYPLATLSSMRIIPTNDPQVHAVQMIVEWPAKGKTKKELMPAPKGGRR